MDTTGELHFPRMADTLRDQTTAYLARAPIDGFQAGNGGGPGTISEYSNVPVTSTPSDGLPRSAEAAAVEETSGVQHPG